MGRKRKIRTPAREFAAKCGRSGTSIDPQTKTLLRHLIMLDDSVKYVFEDFARPYKGIPLAKDKLHESIYTAYMPLLEVIRKEFGFYVADTFHAYRVSQQAGQP